MMPHKEEKSVPTVEDDSASTTTILTSGIKYLSILDEEGGESWSPLMRSRSNSSLNSSINSSNDSAFSYRFCSPPTSPVKRRQSSHTPSSPSSSSSSFTTTGAYQLKNAHDALVGSISAVINFLRYSGVPKPACDQLCKNLEMDRYFAVMKRVQDYIQCIVSACDDDTLARIHLTVTAWEALCRYKNVEYKRAYKSSFQLRYEQSSPGSPSEIHHAIALQIKLAEQCTSCQKKLYLVQKWQRHLLHRMKRSTMIEPQGYQPIRCR